MRNYKALLYKLIGARVRDYRLKNKEGKKPKKGLHRWSQVNIDIDTSILSRIENGKADKRKNPYFLNGTQIGTLCDAFKISEAELIWGKEEEKKSFIKLCIISILINDNNPAFFDGTFEEWVKEEWSYNPIEQKKLSNLAAIDQKQFDFFINKENSTLYSLLDVSFEKDYEMLSNIMLHTLVQDSNFSERFFDHLINYTNNVSNEENSIEALLRNFITYQGSYALLILDRGGIDYHRFIKAFNKFWEALESDFMQYFDKKLFSIDIKFSDVGLKPLSNQFFHEIFRSQEFIELNKQTLLLSEYIEKDSIISSLKMRFKMMHAIQVNRYSETQDTSLIEFMRPIIEAFNKS